MNYFLVQISKKYARSILSFWIFITLIELFMAKVVGEPQNLMTSLLTLGVSVLVSAHLMNSTRWIVFWRRTAASIGEFWSGIIAIQVFNLGLNLAFFYLFSKMSVGNAPDMTVWDLVWVCLIAFTQSLVFMNDVKIVLNKQTLRISRQVIMIVGFYLWIAVLMPLFVYSRLLGYIFIETSLLSLFLLKNTFVMNSIQRSLRYLTLGFCLVGVLALSVASVTTSNTQSTGNSSFLGILGPKKNVQFSELESLQGPSAWIQWFRDVKSLNIDQLLAAIAKLEELCPPKPTDNPTIVRCYEKEVDEESLSIGRKVNDADVNRLLKDSLVYSRLLGLLKARGQGEFSPEVKNSIEEIVKGGGRLGLVAEVTLEHHKQGKDQLLRIVVYGRE